MRACAISSSAFDAGEQFLAVSSSTGTVHVFAIGDKEENGLFGGFANYLSHSLALSKSIARLHLSNSECKWTTKGSTFVGPMVTFSREEAKLVHLQSPLVHHNSRRIPTSRRLQRAHRHQPCHTQNNKLAARGREARVVQPVCFGAGRGEFG